MLQMLNLQRCFWVLEAEKKYQRTWPRVLESIRRKRSYSQLATLMAQSRFPDSKIESKRSSPLDFKVGFMP